MTVERIECSQCDWVNEEDDRVAYVRHKMEAHRPVPGQVFFVERVVRVYLNTGSGRDMFALCDGEGTIAMVSELPKETEFLNVRLAGSRLGAGTPVVAAYDPDRVTIVG